MWRALTAAGLAAALLACGRIGPQATATPAGPEIEPPGDLTMAAIATSVAQATGRPTELPPTQPAVTSSPTIAPATPTAPPTVVPSPTSLAEGLVTRLGTPDPSPGCPEHYPWFFDNPAAECADTLLNTWTVWQPFERGLMVWKQEGGLTYVFVDDGSLFKPYHIVVDGQGLPFPEPDPAIMPPEGFFQPERGFALFWRGLAAGSEWVRPALGWATEPETAFSGFWQCNRATGPAARCYFIGPRDEIMSLTVGGPAYWNYFQTAVR